MNQLKSYLFWILVFLFFFNTVEANAQITLNVKNTEIKDILKRIERQSDYSFFYSENYLDTPPLMRDYKIQYILK